MQGALFVSLICTSHCNWSLTAGAMQRSHKSSNRLPSKGVAPLPFFSIRQPPHRSPAGPGLVSGHDPTTEHFRRKTCSCGNPLPILDVGVAWLRPPSPPRCRVGRSPCCRSLLPLCHWPNAVCGFCSRSLRGGVHSVKFSNAGGATPFPKVRRVVNFRVTSNRPRHRALNWRRRC